MRQISKPPLFVSCALAMGNLRPFFCKEVWGGKAGAIRWFRDAPQTGRRAASPAQRLQLLVDGHQGTAVQTLFVTSVWGWGLGPSCRRHTGMILLHISNVYTHSALIEPSLPCREKSARKNLVSADVLTRGQNFLTTETDVRNLIVGEFEAGFYTSFPPTGLILDCPGPDIEFLHHRESLGVTHFTLFFQRSYEKI